VRKDVQIEGAGVSNYVTKLAGTPWSFKSRHTGVDSVLRVTWDAIKQDVPMHLHSKTLSRLVNHIYMTLHPYWVMEYRRRANWSAGFGVARGHWPAKFLDEYTCLTKGDRFYLWGVYLSTTLGALLLPTSLIEPLKRVLTSRHRHMSSSDQNTSPEIS
jgi:hypothetical protein